MPTGIVCAVRTEFLGGGSPHDELYGGNVEICLAALKVMEVQV